MPIATLTAPKPVQLLSQSTPEKLSENFFFSPLRGKKIYDTICSSLEKRKGVKYEETNDGAIMRSRFFACVASGKN